MSWSALRSCGVVSLPAVRRKVVGEGRAEVVHEGGPFGRVEDALVDVVGLETGVLLVAVTVRLPGCTVVASSTSLRHLGHLHDHDLLRRDHDLDLRHHDRLRGFLLEPCCLALFCCRERRREGNVGRKGRKGRKGKGALQSRLECSAESGGSKVTRTKHEKLFPCIQGRGRLGSWLRKKKRKKKKKAAPQLQLRLANCTEKFEIFGHFFFLDFLPALSTRLAWRGPHQPPALPSFPHRRQQPVALYLCRSLRAPSSNRRDCAFDILAPPARAVRHTASTTATTTSMSTMASTSANGADALDLIRSAIKDASIQADPLASIQLLDDHSSPVPSVLQATAVKIRDVSLPKSTTTRLARSRDELAARLASGSPPDPDAEPAFFYNVEAVILALQARDERPGAYLAQAATAKVASFPTLDRAAILDYLLGRRSDWTGVVHIRDLPRAAADGRVGTHQHQRRSSSIRARCAGRQARLQALVGGAAVSRVAGSKVADFETFRRTFSAKVEASRKAAGKAPTAVGGTRGCLGRRTGAQAACAGPDRRALQLAHQPAQHVQHQAVSGGGCIRAARRGASARTRRCGSRRIHHEPRRQHRSGRTGRRHWTSHPGGRQRRGGGKAGKLECGDARCGCMEPRHRRVHYRSDVAVQDVPLERAARALQERHGRLRALAQRAPKPQRTRLERDRTPGGPRQKTYGQAGGEPFLAPTRVLDPASQTASDQLASICRLLFVLLSFRFELPSCTTIHTHIRIRTHLCLDTPQLVPK
ncbi:hypothetical protein L1887_62126 [Cichorium endivia]|nr:hypothetical protein L1887_62126 [Cichorium endivia]